MFKKARRSLFQRSTSSSPHPEPSSEPQPASKQLFVMPTLAIRPAPPPPAPYPWVWKCHSCHSTYRLGTTRRCLECGHEMCSSASDPTSRSRQSPTKAGRRANKRRRSGGPCRSEFDYSGWAAWGQWKRGLLTAEAKEASFVDCSYSCADHCDYPSECHHTRYRVAQERFEAEAEAKAALEKSDNKKKSGLGGITVTNTITQFFSSAAEKAKASVSSSASSSEGPPASLLQVGEDDLNSDEDSDSDDSSDSDEADEILSNFILETSHENRALDDDYCEDDAGTGLIVFGAIPEQLKQDENKVHENEKKLIELRDDCTTTQLMDDDEDEDEDEDSLHLLQQRRSFSKVAQLTGLDSFVLPGNSSSTSLPSSSRSCSSEMVSTRALSYSLPSLRPESSDNTSDRFLSASAPVRFEPSIGLTDDSVTAWWVEFGRR